MHDDTPAPAATAAPPDRQYLLERVGEAAVVQLYADGFRALSLREKTLVWHLYRAAIAGRDIFYDQRHRVSPRDARSARGHRGPPVQLRPRHASRRFEHYTKLFWINTGAYNNLTARKFVLTCGPERFAAAAHAAVRAGARRAAPRRRIARRPARTAASDVLRSRVRADGHRQEPAARPGHPDGQRQQPARRGDDGGSRGRRRSAIR